MIYYTPATASIFKDDDEAKQRIQTLLGAPDKDFETVAMSGQTELFVAPETRDEFKFRWVGIRLSKAGRLVGAVVTDIKTKIRHFFALEVTMTHDYQKTLTDNKTRRINWRNFIHDYLRSVSIEDTAAYSAAAAPPPQLLVQHGGRFRAPDATQIELLTELPLRDGALCFGPPGAGKSLIAVQRSLAYGEHGLSTAILTPTKRLAEAISGELSQQDVKNVRCFSYDSFLASMNTLYPHLLLMNDSTRTPVDFNYFKNWCQRQKIGKKLKDTDLTTLWQELCYVIMQPNWKHPEKLCLDETTYCELGSRQSSINDGLRKELYQGFFSPFCKEMADNSQLYFPVVEAYKLYNELVKTPPDDGYTFDAMVVDEVQRFHPYQWAAFLQLRKNLLSSENLFICGDAHQGADCQQLRVAEPLRGYFANQDVNIRVYNLSINHRNSQAVSRFVRALHEVELRVLGSMERDTHVDTAPNEHEEEGFVTLTAYEPRFQLQIAQNAEAYVLIPDERSRECAALLWPSHQIVSLQEFSGMSAKTVVMYGFSTFYSEILDSIPKKHEPQELLGEPRPYARKKSPGPADATQRSCLQALYTAASRAEVELHLVEAPNSLHHPLIQDIYQHTLPAQKESAEARLSPAKDTEKVSSPKDWFLRAKTNFELGLRSQAEAILRQEDLWGQDKVKTIKTLIDSVHPTDTFKVLVEGFLVSTKVEAATSVAIASREEAMAAEPVGEPLSKKWCKWLEEIDLTNRVDIRTLSQVKDSALLMQLLFTHKMNNGHCLVVNMVVTEKAADFFKFLREVNKLDAIKRVYQDLEKTNEAGIFLKLCWFEVLNSGKPKKINKEIKDKVTSYARFRELITTDLGVQYILRHWPVFNKETGLINQAIIHFIMNYVCNKGNMIDQWGHLKDSGFISSDMMHRAITDKGPHQGETPFYLLASTEEGPQLIADHWDDFRKSNLLDPSSMHRAITDNGPHQGETPFYLLTSTVEGLKLIADRWNDFKILKLLDPSSMHQEVTAEGENRGETPFYWLTLSQEGLNLISDHWSDFIALGLLSHESMHRVVTAQGPNQGTTPFYELAGTSTGLKLIADHWDDFRKLNLLDPSSMHRVVTAKGENQGKTPFYWLSSSLEGMDLISERWDDFKKLNLLDPQSMHQEVTEKGEDQEETPFYWFTTSPEGLKLITERWDDFKRLRLLDPSSMHRAITAEGPHQGETPFYWFTTSPEGLKLIAERWDDFKKLRLLDPRSMHQATTAEGPHQGKTPFYWLTTSPEGLKLIADHWEDFIEYQLLPTEWIPQEGRKPDNVFDYMKQRIRTMQDLRNRASIAADTVDATAGSILMDQSFFQTKRQQASSSETPGSSHDTRMTS